MSRKTTKAAEAAIERFNSSLKYIQEVIQTRNTQKECNWTSWTKKCTPEFIEGYMMGMKDATEAVLHQQNCYHGFNYVDADGHWLRRGEYESIDQHPEYRDWQVYFAIV